MPKITYYVCNADGVEVAQYEIGEHAVWSARENALAGSARNLDLYYVDARDENMKPVDTEYNLEFPSLEN